MTHFDSWTKPKPLYYAKALDFIIAGLSAIIGDKTDSQVAVCYCQGDVPEWTKTPGGSFKSPPGVSAGNCVQDNFSPCCSNEGSDNSPTPDGAT